MSNVVIPTEHSLSERLKNITTAIEAASLAAQRPKDAVQLLAVTKTQPLATIRAAYDLGLRAFGENYMQEGVDKINAFQIEQPNNTAIWHFIGPLQSNKTRAIAENFDWVHGVDRLKIAQRLSEQRPKHLPPLNVLIQVNISNEASKSGCAPEEAIELALQIIQLPHVYLRGLMSIPAIINPEANEKDLQAPFVALAQLHSTVKVLLPTEQASIFDTLSMGMSNDFPHAIAAGATLVRIGSAIFGSRPQV